MIDFLIILFFIVSMWVIGTAFVFLAKLESDERQLALPIGLSVYTIVISILYLNIGLSIVQIQVISFILVLLLLCYIIRKKAYLLTYKTLFIVCGLFIFLCLPAFIGGESYYVFRGNIHDNFNYITAALACYSYPLGYYKVADEAFQLSNDLLIFGNELAASRPAIMITFATTLTEGFGNIFLRAFCFTTVFSALFFPVLYYACFKLFKKLSDNSNYKILIFIIPFAYIVGFWGQLCYDINAWSQLAALPLLVNLTFLYCKFLKDLNSKISINISAVVSLLGVAAFYLYPEASIIYMVIAFFFTIYFLYYNRHVIAVKKILIILCIPLLILLFSLLQWNETVLFILNQANYGISGVNNWWMHFNSYWFGNGEFLSWFWGIPNLIPSVFGFSFITASSNVFWLIKPLWYILSCLFSVSIIFCIYANMRYIRVKENYYLFFVKSSFIICILFAGAFAIFGQLWSAGKLMVYASPFIFLFFSLPFFFTYQDRLQSKYKKYLVIFSCLFIISNIGFGGYRIYKSNNPDNDTYLKNYPILTSIRNLDYTFQVDTDLKTCKSIFIFSNDSFHLHYMKLKLLYAGKQYYLSGLIQNYYNVSEQYMPLVDYDCTAIVNPKTNLIEYNTDEKKYFTIGLSGLEVWGQWSNGETIEIGPILDSIPDRFRLILDIVNIFGENSQYPAKIKIGNNVYELLINQLGTYVIDFENVDPVNKIEIIIPKPQSPKELGLSEDTRKLGYGFAKDGIRIEKIKEENN